MTKQELIAVQPKGYTYIGQWDDMYHFQTGNYSDGFMLLSCNEQDLTNGNIEYMAKHGLTRVKPNFTPNY